MDQQEDDKIEVANFPSFYEQSQCSISIEETPCVKSNCLNEFGSDLTSFVSKSSLVKAMQCTITCLNLRLLAFAFYKIK